MFGVIQKSVEEKLSDKECKDFILAALNLRETAFYGFGPYTTLLEDLTERALKEIFQEAVAEIINSEVKAAIKERIRENLTTEQLYFAADAATSEFVERLKRPIDGNRIQIKFMSDDEEE